jgi:hypothetical protein
MKKRLVIVTGVCTFVIGLVSMSFASEFSGFQPEVKTYNGVMYLSGGIGVDELETLRLMEKDYALKLSFAEKAGNYLSDVQVVIKDTAGDTVLDAVSQGPWLFTKLPAGKYTVMATTMGRTHQQVARVTSKGQTWLYFYW